MVVRPRRWRLWAAVALVGWCLIAAVAFVVSDPGPLPRAFPLFAAIPLVPVLAYPLAMTRSITVRPGVDLAFRDLLGRRRRVPVDGGTELISFTEVEGSSRHALRRAAPTASPIGVIDQRWAVLRSGDRTRIRLSSWFWSPSQLAHLAQAAPLPFRIRAQPIDAAEITTAFPDYYTWLERHPRLYLAVLFIAVLVVAASVLVTTACGLYAVRAIAPAP